jgi:elongator complex protein 2
MAKLSIINNENFQYINTISRDRTWCLWNVNGSSNDDNMYKLIMNTNKKTSVHQRIIWSCDWSMDSRLVMIV